MTNTVIWTKMNGIHVAGTSFHQGTLFHALKLLKADKNESVKASLVLDKTNKYDENAIKVILRFKNNAKGYPIGFIPKERRNKNEKDNCTCFGSHFVSVIASCQKERK